MQQSINLIQKVKTATLAMQRNSWEQGVVAQAFLEMGENDLVVLMAKEALNRQNDEGRLAVLYNDQGVTDPAANGEAVLYAGTITGDAAFKTAAERMLNWLLHQAPRTKTGILHHIKNIPQVWVDSIYMGPPFIAVAGRPDEAVRQIEGMRQLLWLPEAKLYAHVWDEAKQTFQRKDCWGVGNGWAAAGITRIIRALPTEMKDEKQRLVGYIREVIDGCLAHLRPDGLFHNIVDKPDSFIETNLAQMIAYSIYSGIHGGWLDSSYKPAADHMRGAAHQKVDAYGLVQGVCGAPEFDHSGTAPEGQAFFLLMESAFNRLKG